MNSNFTTKATGLPLINDPESKRQWDEIDDQLRDMQLLLNEDISTIPSSPANLNASVVTRSHSSQYNPLYRRSEGDILGTTLSTSASANPPQSAPVLPEGYQLKWEDQQGYVSTGMAMNSKQEGNRGDTPGNILTAESTLLGAIPEIKHGHSRSAQGAENFSYMRPSNSSPMIAAYSSAVKVQSSSSNVPQQYSPFQPTETSHTPMFPLLHQASFPLLPTHKNSPSARRKSAPITSSILRNRSTPRLVSQIPNIPGMGFSAFSEEEFGLNMVQTPEDEKQPTDANNDKEYTRALVKHQRDRMIRLEKEIVLKKNELKKLYENMKMMELKIQQRNSNNKAFTTLQFDVSRLREINRKLKIDCNCMYKEVELFSRDGDSTSDDFYSRYNRPQSIKNKSKKDVMRPMYPHSDLPPPPPPPSEPIEEAKWRCSHCTFDNHAALNKCEIRSSHNFAGFRNGVFRVADQTKQMYWRAIFNGHKNQRSTEQIAASFVTSTMPRKGGKKNASH